MTIVPCALMVFSILVIQGICAPWIARLAAYAIDMNGWQDALIFATAVIGWRTVWSLFPLLNKSTAGFSSPWFLLKRPLFSLRVLMTVVTQLTFIMAITSIYSVNAWPILNSAGLMAMVMASLLLNEKAHHYQTMILLMVAALTVIRFVTL